MTNSNLHSFGLLTEADLAPCATGRSESLFAADVAKAGTSLQTAVTGKRILVIGGAGSIGGATTELIADLRPAALHVVDQDENRLVELVRTLRSRPQRLRVADFRTLPLDFGADIMRMFLNSQAPYDAVLNFSAMKHVRSEKDSFSLLRILDINVVRLARLMTWLADCGHKGRLFSVSTDKAANPTSLMGASKRLMEHVMFAAEDLAGLDCVATSTRFANVAFSNGSLLQGFLQRLAKLQPLALPRATRRYFVSPEESGHICLLASQAAPDRAVVIPRLHAETDLVELQSVAERVLARLGLQPSYYDDETLAVAAVKTDIDRCRYPVLLTPLDTSGEKAYEEFVGDGEREREIGYGQLTSVDYLPAPAGTLKPLVHWLTEAIAGHHAVTKEGIIERIAAVVPALRHIETGKNLDQRM